MDGDNRNGGENVHLSNKMKKKQNSPKKKILVHSPGENSGQNELSPNKNKNKAKFVAKDIKNKVEKEEPKERESNSNENPKNNTDATNYNKNLPAMKTPHQKKMNSKSFKRKFENQAILQSEGNIVLNELTEDTFELEDIINNSKALDLVQDLVNCFTLNSTLPEDELQTLKVSLFEKTCSVLLDILNTCVRKIFSRVVYSDFFQELKKKHVSKKDACCQTSFSDLSGVEKSEMQENVSP